MLFAHHDSLKFDNSYYLELGFEYDISEEATVRAGTSYDRGAVPAEALSLVNIDNEKVTLFGGGSYRWGVLEVSAAGFYAFGHDRSTVGGGEYAPPGTYDLDSGGFLLSVSRSIGRAR